MLRKLTVLTASFLMMVPLCAFAVETKNIQFKMKNAEPVTFSHEVHLAKYKNCKICHDAIYNLRNRRHFTMADMQKGKSCGACHSGMKAFSVATDADCSKCHKGKPKTISYKVKGLGEVPFNHSAHEAKTGGACNGCHNNKSIAPRTAAVTMAEMEKGKSCGLCHNGKRTFTVAGNCNRCHKGMNPKDVTFTLKDVAPATFSHSFHTQVYSCKDCHTKTFPYKAVTGKATMDDMAKGKSCGTCHDGKTAFASTGDCAKCHKGLKPGKVKFKTEAGEATFSHEFHLQAYKCADCHTGLFPYKAVTGKATMADMEKGKSCGACHNKGKDAFSVAGDCEKCHKM